MEKKDLKPAALFQYFEEICQVPRPSKHEEKIIAYLKAFGEKHQLETKIDELNKNDYKIVRFSVDPLEDGHLKVNMHIREHSYGDGERPLLQFIRKFEDLRIEKIE